MRYNRRKALTILGAATAATVLTQAAPSQAGNPPLITYTSPYIGWDDGLIRVAVSSEAPITAIRARFLTQQGGAQIAEFSAFDLKEGSATQGTWINSQAVVLPRLGTFWVIWEAESANGTGTKEVQFNYWRLAVVSDLTVSPSVIDARNRTVEVSGNLQWQHPGTLARSPLTSYPIDVWAVPINGQPDYPRAKPVTDASGHFRAQLTLHGGGDIWLATGWDPEGFTFSGGGELSVDMQVTATRIHMEIDKPTVTLGEAITATGLLQQQVDGNWVALPNKDVSFGYDNRSQTLWEKIRTDSGGHFKKTFTPSVPGSCFAIFNQTGSGSDLFFTEARSETTEILALKKITISPDLRVWQLNRPWSPNTWAIQGNVDVPDGFSFGVEIQAADKPEGPWQKLTSTDTRSPVSGQSTFYGEFKVSGKPYIRAFIPRSSITWEAASPAIWLATLMLSVKGFPEPAPPRPRLD